MKPRETRARASLPCPRVAARWWGGGGRGRGRAAGVHGRGGACVSVINHLTSRSWLSRPSHGHTPRVTGVFFQAGGWRGDSSRASPYLFVLVLLVWSCSVNMFLWLGYRVLLCLTTLEVLSALLMTLAGSDKLW